MENLFLCHLLLFPFLLLYFQLDSVQHRRVNDLRGDFSKETFIPGGEVDADVGRLGEGRSYVQQGAAIKTKSL